MLDDHEFVGRPILDRSGTPVGTVVEILHGEQPRARVRIAGATREIGLAEAQYDSTQRVFRLPYDAENVPA